MKRLLLTILLAIAALPSHAAVLTLEEYTAALVRLRGYIATKQADAAHFEAAGLKEAEVDSPNGRFHADAALLTDVEAGRERTKLLAHLDATIAALRTVAPVPAASPDAARLEEARHEEEVAQLQKGGTVAGLTEPEGPWYQRFVKWLRELGHWLRELFERFLDWLEKFWPKQGPRKSVAMGGMRWIVIAIVVLIVMIVGVLAAEVIRRSRAAPADATQESAPIGSRRDEDPLSRGATEWERYAAQLAAAGRFREAIRAWYHAVLVTAYSAHILHYRKGRTNWEYVAAVGPSVAWRPEFVQLTRRFEQEWYGSDRSSQEALDECSTRAQRILDAIRRAAREAA